VITDFVQAESGSSLKDVFPAALTALGLTTDYQGELDIPAARHVVVVLIDGLGTEQLERHPLEAPFLVSCESRSISTEFPSTTPVALGSLGTGLPPGGHGLIGASFWLPDDEEMFAPLKWGSTPHPLSLAPEPTIFEIATNQGVDVATIADGKHKESGLTRSVMRGSQYMPAQTPSEIIAAFRDRLDTLEKTNARGLTYIYWPDLDRVGHVNGPDSCEWMFELTRVDALAQDIVSLLGSEDVAVVTSDHGMIRCSPENRIHIESNPSLVRGITRVGGEPRVRHLYTEVSATRDVLDTWQTVLHGKVKIFTRDEVVTNGLYSVTEDEIAGRVGDLMAIALGDYALSSDRDRNSSKLLGQHGSLTREEMIVPFLVFRGGNVASVSSWEH
jgi:hypothetical protein